MPKTLLSSWDQVAENPSPLINALKQGQIGVLPTDTIYGIVASALDPQAVEKVYQIRDRSPQKPMIILISSLDDLKLFSIKLTEHQHDLLSKIWPNPISVVLPCTDPEFAFLHRTTNTLALRLPKDPELRQLLSKAGPLIAPSANPQGLTPATTIQDARQYFGDKISFYIDKGPLHSPPSTLVSLTDDQLTILREGSTPASFFENI